MENFFGGGAQNKTGKVAINLETACAPRTSLEIDRHNHKLKLYIGILAKLTVNTNFFFVSTQSQ
jgi:hypothetical protein